MFGRLDGGRDASLVSEPPPPPLGVILAPQLPSSRQYRPRGMHSIERAQPRVPLPDTAFNICDNCGGAVSGCFLARPSNLPSTPIQSDSTILLCGHVMCQNCLLSTRVNSVHRRYFCRSCATVQPAIVLPSSDNTNFNSCFHSSCLGESFEGRSYLCIPCMMEMCSSCAILHASNNPTHEINKLSTSKLNSARPFTICPIHQKSIIGRCACGEMVCDRCIAAHRIEVVDGKHIHQIKGLTERDLRLEDEMLNVMGVMKRVRAAREMIERQRNRLRENVDRVNNEIAIHFDQIIEQAIQRCFIVMRSVRDAAAAREKTMEIEMEQIDAIEKAFTMGAEMDERSRDRKTVMIDSVANYGRAAAYSMCGAALNKLEAVESAQCLPSALEITILYVNTQSILQGISQWGKRFSLSAREGEGQVKGFSQVIVQPTPLVLLVSAANGLQLQPLARPLDSCNTPDRLHVTLDLFTQLHQSLLAGLHLPMPLSNPFQLTDAAKTENWTSEACQQTPIVSSIWRVPILRAGLMGGGGRELLHAASVATTAAASAVEAAETTAACVVPAAAAAPEAAEAAPAAAAAAAPAAAAAAVQPPPSKPSPVFSDFLTGMSSRNKLRDRKRALARTEQRWLPKKILKTPPVMWKAVEGREERLMQLQRVLPNAFAPPSLAQPPPQDEVEQIDDRDEDDWQSILSENEMHEFLLPNSDQSETRKEVKKEREEEGEWQEEQPLFEGGDYVDHTMKEEVKEECMDDEEACVKLEEGNDLPSTSDDLPMETPAITRPECNLLLILKKKKDYTQSVAQDMEDTVYGRRLMWINRTETPAVCTAQIMPAAAAAAAPAALQVRRDSSPEETVYGRRLKWINGVERPSAAAAAAAAAPVKRDVRPAILRRVVARKPMIDGPAPSCTLCAAMTSQGGLRGLKCSNCCKKDQRERDQTQEADHQSDEMPSSSTDLPSSTINEIRPPPAGYTPPTKVGEITFKKGGKGRATDLNAGPTEQSRQWFREFAEKEKTKAQMMKMMKMKPAAIEKDGAEKGLKRMPHPILRDDVGANSARGKERCPPSFLRAPSRQWMMETHGKTGVAAAAALAGDTTAAAAADDVDAAAAGPRESAVEVAAEIGIEREE